MAIRRSMFYDKVCEKFGNPHAFSRLVDGVSYPTIHSYATCKTINPNVAVVKRCAASLEADWVDVMGWIMTPSEK